jgi:hypothetical protein
MKWWGIVAVAAAVALGGSACAQSASYLVRIEPVQKAQGFEKIRLSKAAVGSAEIRLWANVGLDPDCTAHEPGPTLTVLRPPEHGTARISDAPFYAAFPPNNPRAACDRQKVPGHQAFYAADAGYVGRDRVVLQGSSPEGRVREITVDIDVR